MKKKENEKVENKKEVKEVVKPTNTKRKSTQELLDSDKKNEVVAGVVRAASKIIEKKKGDLSNKTFKTVKGLIDNKDENKLKDAISESEKIWKDILENKKTTRLETYFNKMYEMFGKVSKELVLREKLF